MHKTGTLEVGTTQESFIKEVGSSKIIIYTFGTISCLERQGNNLPAR